MPPVAPIIGVIEMPVVDDFGDLGFAEIVSEGEEYGRHCSQLVVSEIAELVDLRSAME